MNVIEAEEDAEVSPYNLLHALTNQLSMLFGTFLLDRDFLGDIILMVKHGAVSHTFS